MAKCLWCGNSLREILDLGSQPLANSLLKTQYEPETTYPLIFCQCEKCHLSQTMRFEYNCFGSDYPYYSSVSSSYVAQCKVLADRLIQNFRPKSVIEIGSNDGYMLQNFKDIPHVGFEPSKGPNDVARSIGLSTYNGYFTASETKVDLIIAFNVMAHTPDLRQMIQDIRSSLNPKGMVLVEIQDLSKLLARGYFDTIYHEHYSYYEFNTLLSCFAEEGLEMIDWQELPSHGGSIRAFFKHKSGGGKTNYSTRDFEDFSALKMKAQSVKTRLRQLVKENEIVAFGAPAKGNTLLNYAGLTKEDICFTVDDTPAKQGKYLPGSRIPIKTANALAESTAEYCLILPWNFESDIIAKIKEINPRLHPVIPHNLV